MGYRHSRKMAGASDLRSVKSVDAAGDRPYLPDRHHAVQRAGEYRGLVRAAGSGLLELKSRYVEVGTSAEAQRSDRERTRDDLVPAIGEQDRDHPGGGDFAGAHTADSSRVPRRLLGAAAWAARSRSNAAISVWSLLSASDRGVPPQRSTGC